MDACVFRRPTVEDIPAMAALAAGLQGDPDHHIIYLGHEATSIAVDLGELERWTETATVAEADGEIVGWLVAEVDSEMGRTWWWGPFVADSAERGARNGGNDKTVDWAETADILYDETRALLGQEVTEEEACADERSEPLRQWCERHGLTPETASVLLRKDPTPGSEAGPAPGSIGPDITLRPLAEIDHQVVMALHDSAFPGTHTTAAALVQSTSHPRVVAEVDGSIEGYVAYESQSDGSGYIDYLAVHASCRGRGVGGALVEYACDELFAGGASYAHLTVRADNGAARSLYRRVGFTEERVAVPFRSGFHLE